MLPDYSSSQSIEILRLAISSEALLQCKHHRIPCISKQKFLYYVRHRGFVPINWLFGSFWGKLVHEGSLISEYRILPKLCKLVSCYN